MKYETRVVAAGDAYDFECACGFTSTGWAQKKQATARGAEHTAEHETGEPMRELVEFRQELGLNGEPVELVRFADYANNKLASRADNVEG